MRLAYAGILVLASLLPNERAFGGAAHSWDKKHSRE